MSLIYTPLPGMVPVYPFVKIQDYLLGLLIAHAAAMNAIDPNFSFDAVRNKSENYIEENAKNGLVNIVIDDVGTQQGSILSKEHLTKIDLELYWRGEDDDSGYHGDEVATEFLLYLGANVEFVVTALYNMISDGVDFGDMLFKSVNSQYRKPLKIGDSSSIWGLGKITLEMSSIYNYDDTIWPNLESVFLDLQNTQSIFPANP